MVAGSVAKNASLGNDVILSAPEFVTLKCIFCSRGRHETKPDRTRKISLEGLSVGDAFGETFFVNPDVVEGLIEQRALATRTWTYTDDTLMPCRLCPCCVSEDIFISPHWRAASPNVMTAIAAMVQPCTVSCGRLNPERIGLNARKACLEDEVRSATVLRCVLLQLVLSSLTISRRRLSKPFDRRSSRTRMRKLLRGDCRRCRGCASLRSTSRFHSARPRGISGVLSISRPGKWGPRQGPPGKRHGCRCFGAVCRRTAWERSQGNCARHC